MVEITVRYREPGTNVFRIYKRDKVYIYVTRGSSCVCTIHVNLSHRKRKRTRRKNAFNNVYHSNNIGEQRLYRRSR
ncbi:MAG: hypothetical protein QW607_11735 [Desulfurococcaceae archaeon]